MATSRSVGLGALLRAASVSVVMAGVLAGCGGSGGNMSTSTPPGPFALASSDLTANGDTFSNNQTFNGFGCTGTNVSPALNWTNAPAGTKSFVLTVLDPDAPNGSGFWHWMVVDIPPTVTSLPASAGTAGSGLLPAGAIQGYNDYGISSYGGPCPPPGDEPHRYLFNLYAMNTATLGTSASSPGALVSFSTVGNTLGKAEFVATFGRPGVSASQPQVPALAGFTLSSPDIPASGVIPNNFIFDKFGCTGNNVSPALVWNGAPAATKSFVVMIHDPDAPTGSGFWHWAMFNIPAATTSLAQNAGIPASGIGIQGTSDYGLVGYGGPCPPVGAPPHHYVFTVFALKVADLTVPAVGGLASTDTGGKIGFVTHNNAIAQASFTATFGR